MSTSAVFVAQPIVSLAHKVGFASHKATSSIPRKLATPSTFVAGTRLRTCQGPPALTYRSTTTTRGRTRLLVSMGPPIPPSADHIGHTVGTGKVHLGVYLDYCCPFSGKMYNMLFGKVKPHYGEKVKLTFYHQVQPWHPQSTYMHEAALAVAKVAGEDAFWKFSTALFENAETYYDVNTFDLTRRQIYESLAELAGSVGVDKAKVMNELVLSAEALASGQKNPGNGVTQNVKWEVKASRQMSMHVSPTTTLNGLVYDTSSGWSLEQWTELLDPLV